MLKNYNAAEVFMIFGPIIITGLADGTFCKIQKRTEAFGLKVGADGQGARSKSNDNSADITFTLLQSSDANAQLSAAHNVDLASPSGDGVAPLLIKDNSGNTIASAPHAWIKKMADVEFARDITMREWTIETDSLVEFVGGNNAPS